MTDKNEIINDLTIMSKHIKINHQNAERRVGFATSDNAIQVAESTKTTILDVVKRINEPFRAIQDSRGYVYDATTIAVYCGKNHPHKYLIRDVLSIGIDTCKTCTCGTKSIQNMRELAETIFKTTFIISTTKYDTTESIEFINRKLAIVISFVKKSDNIINNIQNSTQNAQNTKNTKDNKYKIVRITTNRNIYKFKQELYNSLIDYDKLSGQQRVDLAAAVGIYPTSSTELSLLGAIPFPDTQLPMSREMAGTVIKKNPNIDCTILASTLNIVNENDSKYLCIENC